MATAQIAFRVFKAKEGDCKKGILMSSFALFAMVFAPLLLSRKIVIVIAANEGISPTFRWTIATVAAITAITIGSIAGGVGGYLYKKHNGRRY